MLTVLVYQLNQLSLFKGLVLVYLFFVFYYLGMLLATGLEVLRKESNFKLLYLTVFAIFVTHFFYGTLFIKGFLTRDLARV